MWNLKLNFSNQINKNLMDHRLGQVKHDKDVKLKRFNPVPLRVKMKVKLKVLSLNGTIQGELYNYPENRC